MGLLRELYLFRKTIILIVSPIILFPLLICSPEDFFSEAACAYTILLMAVYWVSEVVPLAVTALLPLVMYPFLGVLPAKVVSVQYLKDVNVLFLGGLTVAVAVEHWNLHKRIALKVLTLVGTKPKWLLFGFMITTAFLSMWISNVATTAMMIPIAQAVLSEMNADDESDGNDSGCSNTPEEDLPPQMISGTESTALTSEMGNITEAQELGARLASHDASKVPKWAHTDISVRFSKGSTYSRVFSEENGNGSSHHDVSVTMIDSEEGPDNSTQKLVTDSDMTITIKEDGKDKQQKHQGMCKALTICICYAANIGGTATLTGTGPNLIMAGQFKTTYPNAPEVDFGSWAVYAFPGMVLFLMFTWVWLQFLFLDLHPKEIFSFKKQSRSSEEMRAEAVIFRQYKELGPMCFAEILVLILFISLALLWLTRDPGFITGWGNLSIFRKKYISDATVAMLITFLLFVCPSRPPNIFCCRPTGTNDKGPVPPLLTWAVVQQKMAWNVILLLGGGFAMALGSKTSGLSAWIGTKLEPLSGIHPFGAAFICCLVICALTQCTSNTATATVFIPILAELAEILRVNPLFLLLPATVTTSYAFMLPVSTPPNAIAYSYGHLKMMDMVKAGSLLNLIGIIVVLISVYAMGHPSFNVFENCPEWLESEYCGGLRNVTNVAENNTVFSLAFSATTVGTTVS